MRPTKTSTHSQRQTPFPTPLWRSAPSHIGALVAALGLMLGACASDPAPKGDQTMVSTDAAVAAAPMSTCGDGLALSEVFHVWQLLMAFDRMPDGPMLSKASKDPVAVLLFLSKRTDITPSIRQRAFESMSALPDERVEAAYKETIADPNADNLRHSAINGYARAWPTKAVQTLGPILTSDPDPQIRLTAAAALCAFGGQEGLNLVKNAALKESEDWIKDKMKNYANPKVLQLN